jgi:carboxyl-terminal processing protease
VIGIDGNDVTGTHRMWVLQSILAPADTVVTLTITREGVEQPLDIPSHGPEIQIPVVEYQMLDSNIAYIDLYQFSVNAGEEVRKSLDELLPQNPVGIILDLRNNSGGYLDAAFDVTSLFIEDGPIMVEEYGDGNHPHLLMPWGGAIARIIPWWCW